MGFGSRMKSLRQERGLSLAELGRRSGVDLKTLAALEARDSAYSRFAAQIAYALSVSAETLLSSDPPQTLVRSPAAVVAGDASLLRVPMVTISRADTSYSVEVADDAEATPIVFQSEWFTRRGFRPGRVVAVRVAGASMSPTLDDGDLCVINLDDTTPADGALFAVLAEQDTLLRRLVRDAGQWWLAADNADQRRYPRKVLDEHCIVVGRVVHRQSDVI